MTEVCDEQAAVNTLAKSGVVVGGVVGASVLAMATAEAQTREPVITDTPQDQYISSADCGPTPEDANPYTIEYLGPAGRGDVPLRIVEGTTETFGTVAFEDPYSDTAEPGDDVQIFDRTFAEESLLVNFDFSPCEASAITTTVPEGSPSTTQLDSSTTTSTTRVPASSTTTQPTIPPSENGGENGGNQSNGESGGNEGSEGNDGTESAGQDGDPSTTETTAMVGVDRGGELPRTGSDSTELLGSVALGLVLIVAGGIGVVRERLHTGQSETKSQ